MALPAQGNLLSPGSCWEQWGGEGAREQAEGARAPQTHSRTFQLQNTPRCTHVQHKSSLQPPKTGALGKKTKNDAMRVLQTNVNSSN